MSEVSFTLTELEIPPTLETGTGPEFLEMVLVRNKIETATLGTDALNPTASELLIHYLGQVEENLRLFLIRVGPQIVGRAVMGWSHAPGARVTDINIEVLPDFRGNGIASRVLEQLQQVSLDEGRTTIQSWPLHSPLDELPHLPSPTGFGHLSAGDPGAKFLLKQGFTLEQIERVSFLDLPMDPNVLSQLRSQAQSHADGYHIHEWFGRTPQRWRSDLAVLRSRMSTDAPSADLDVDELVWDVGRIDALDTGYLSGGTHVVTAAAEHLASGKLVGFTELAVAAGSPGAASQMDTLVHGNHRGHRLGMLLKVANLQALTAEHPQVRLVTTFNAEENRPMLSVNEAIGFRAAGRAAGWQKLLTNPSAI